MVTTPNATTAALQQSLNGVVGYYQPQTAQEKAYADALAQYVGGLDAQYGKYGGTQLTGDRYAQLPFGGPQLYQAPTSSQMSSYYGKTPEQNTFYTFNLPSNKGNQTGQVNVNYNTPVALYDYATGKLVYSGTGFEAAEKAAEMAANLSSTGGNKANWGIFTGAPGSTDPSTFKQVAYEKPNASVVGQVADVALPTIGAILGGPLGAAAGSAVSSVAQGRGVGDTLMRAALSGGLSYAGGQIMGGSVAGGAGAGAGGGAGSGVATGLTQGVLQSGVQEIGTEIIVTAAQKAVEQGLASSISQAISSGVAAAIADTMTGNAMQGYEPGAVKPVSVPASVNGAETVVTAGWRPSISGLTAGTGGAAGAGVGGALPRPTTQPTNQPYDANELEPEIPVTATPKPPVNPFNAAIAAGMGPLPANLTMPSQQQLDSMTPEEKQSFLDKIRQYYSYGSLGLSALGAVAGALGSQKSPSSAGATGVTDPLFSAKLPEAGAGFGSSDFAARPVSTYGGTGVGNGMTMDDWLTYGMRPERSFFSYVPENTATIAEPVTPTDGTDTGDTNTGGGGVKPPRTPRGPRVRDRDEEQGPRVREPRMRVARAMGGYAAGGSRKTFAVEGAGTGRSDDIPAVLSDGEYVMDAETVALLGDGSSKAGAKKLDQFRVNVRKHKGSKLAKGRFSANAKRPEKYLSGGKA